MMAHGQKHTTVGFKTYFIILSLLIVLTFVSVLVTHIDVGKLGIFTALLIAGIKSSLVLAYFMHLIFDNKIYSLFTGLVIFIIAAVLIITFFDYSFR